VGTFTIWIEAFSGLGLFLFGMLYLESQIKAAAGRAFKQWIRQTTNTHFKSLLSGIFATALFQSSSVVTLMALSLIGAQIMTLESGIAVIFGSNIGTTITAWIVGLIGFKMDIKLLSYLFIGIGGLGGVLAGDGHRWKSYFGAMVGFGLIFLGLEGMKESFTSFSTQLDISKYHFENPYWYALIGFGLTAVIQSSSASIAIIQSALFAHMVGFDAAASFVIGSNIGTTVTAFLGAIGGTPDKKRTALAHFLFNVSTGIVALLLLRPLVHGVLYILPQSDPVIQIALFHTVFNLMGVLLWYPFIGVLTKGLQKVFTKEQEHVTEYIHNVTIQLPDVAYDALDKEIVHLAKEVESFALLAINIPPAKALKEFTSVEKLLNEYQDNFDLSYDRLYTKIRLLEGEILRFITKVATQSTDPFFQEKLNRQARKVTYLATAAKTIKDMLHDLDRLYDAQTAEELHFLRNLRYQILQSVQVFDKAFLGEKEAYKEMNEIYHKIAKSYRNSMMLISDIAKNNVVSSTMLTIAINDMHLSKSFTKSLRNILLLEFQEKEENESSPQR
jgi:phosphate:Na+ symporter